jgi:hypothetical protein
MLTAIITGLLFIATTLSAQTVPTTINDFELPGSQPGDSGTLQNPGNCDNCHGGYDPEVEPDFLWRGTMMGQAARDRIYLATLAIANQDAGESGDMCIRCHAPKGWLEGRSEPTDGSALTDNDREGIQCAFCHQHVKPTPPGVNPFPDDPDYTADTYPADQDYLATLENIPPQDGNGAYIVDSGSAKRGPFLDANARHQMLYSPYHSDPTYCGTCHDVSNPAFSRQEDGSYAPNALDTPAPSFVTYDMLPVERTYSEWLMSAYNSPEGIYAPQFGGNKDYVSTCQDCHMKDVTGVGCNKNGVPVRDDLPWHDMTGGNTVAQGWIALEFPDEVNHEALAASVLRARYMLQEAASLELSTTGDPEGILLNVRVTNETGHKLPSGYPEGRRIWLQVSAYDLAGTSIYESGEYLWESGDLIHDPDVKIYQIKPGFSTVWAAAIGLEAGPSFHFAINDTVYSDNRIPPRGFTNEAFTAIQSPPVSYSYEDGQYWDDTPYLLPFGTDSIAVNLLYQTTSKEYITFLRDENTTTDDGDLVYALWENNGMAPPETMRTASLKLLTLLPIDDLNIITDSDSLYLSWSPVQGATQYRVYALQAPFETMENWQLLQETAATSFNEPLATAPNHRFYRVVATAVE